LIEGFYRAIARLPWWLRWSLAALILGVVVGFVGSVQAAQGEAGPGLLPQFLNHFINGLALGCIYALIALGFTMIYAVVELLQFAHADIFMLGSFGAYFALRWGISNLYLEGAVPLWAVVVMAALVGMAVAGLLGYLVEKLAYRPLRLRGAAPVAGLIAAIGLSIMLQNLANIFFSPDPRSFPPQSFVIYQLEVADTPDFQRPRRFRVVNQTAWQAPEELMGRDFYLRIKARSQRGESAFSPPVKVEGRESARFIRFGEEAQEGGLSIGFVSYSRRVDERGRQLLTISWEKPPLDAISFPELVPRTPLTLMGSGVDAVTVTPVQLIIFAGTLVLFLVLFILLYRTQLGIALRGVSQDPMAIKLMGVDADTIVSFTFVLVSASAGLAGVLWGLYLVQIFPLMGLFPGIKSIVAAVVGGMGNVPGAVVGGLTVGVLENLVKGFIADRYSPLADAIVFLLLILILLVKPSGLLGSPKVEKV